MRATHFCFFFAFAITMTGTGCTALVEGTLAGRGSDAGIGTTDTGSTPDTGPMPDSGPSSPCNGLPDGVHCTMAGIDEPFVCLRGVCELSACGDGIVDARMGSMHAVEECDDGNTVSGDGCEMDCTYSCHASTDCDDTLFCDGDETCDTTMHACQSGTAQTDTTPCVAIGGGAGICMGGVCQLATCGDGTVETGEQCDDGQNGNPDDGCRDDCTYSCNDASQCQNDSVCDGSESCDTTTTHTCQPPTDPLDCDDMDPCTADACDPSMGCTYTSVLVDADGDGFFAITTSCGGDDCDDTNAAAHPSADEPCGSPTDLNCDGHAGTTPTWYADCDGDGYAALGAVTTTTCANPPTPGPSSCSTGHWTTRVPSSRLGGSDCLDTNSSAHPGQTNYYTAGNTGLHPTFDWNCSAANEYEVTHYGDPPASGTYTSCHVTTVGTLMLCSGDQYWAQTSRPACGSTGTLASCGWVTLFGTQICTYRQTTGVTARCH
jgi:cysteine-rich repeat protein